MLIENREQFEQMLQDIREAATVVFDTEATGLHLRHEDRVIGLSVYLPHVERGYYLAWAHGQKKVNSNYESIRNWTPAKKLAYAYSVYEQHLKSEVLKQNVPVEWLQELRDVWTTEKRYIGHNIQFDLTAISTLNFPIPETICDTMSMLSVVNSDWIGNKKEGYYPVFEMPNGNREPGSRSLKWQARLWGLDQAESGIDSLDTAVQELRKTLINLGGANAVLRIKGEDSLDDAAQVHLWMLKPEQVALYAIEDTRLTWLLYKKILRFSEKWGDTYLHALYNQITKMVWEMQHIGFRINLDHAKELIVYGQQRLNELQGEIYRESDERISSANSPVQVKNYLNAIGIRVESTGKEILDKISGVPLIKKIQTYKNIRKILSTYVETWAKNHVQGYVHPELNVGGTGTGRLSSSSDMFGNYQNVPRTSAKGEINPKTLLYPPEGNIILDLDYQALEMRLAAWVAETIIPNTPYAILKSVVGEQGARRLQGLRDSLVLTRLIEDDEDMHAYTMNVSGIYEMLLNGRSEEAYLVDEGYNLSLIDDPVEYFRDKVARYKAKTTNFAAIYGAGVRGIMKAVGCTEAQARVLLNGYHKAYPAVRPAMEFMQKLALKQRALPCDPDRLSNYVVYPLPEVALRRKYNFYPVYMKNVYGGSYSPMDKAARGAFNSVVQGTGGLLVLKSILKIKEQVGFATYRVEGNKRIYDYDSGLVVPHLTVHDSFVLSLRPENLNIVPEIMKIMSQYPTRPLLGVDASAAPINGSWGETTKVKNMELWINSQGREGL